MARIINLTFAFVFMLLLLIGCSSGQDNPLDTQIPNTENTSKGTPPSGNEDILSALGNLPVIGVDESQTNRQLSGMWTLNFDREKSIMTAEPYRDLAGHINVGGMISPSFRVISSDPLTGIVSVDATITNPLPLVNGFDVRMIVYTDNYGNRLMNPDDWTPLYDIAGGAQINPIKAFAKNVQNRVFASFASHTERFQLYYPAGLTQPVFAIDVSLFGNCEEPYLINNFKQDKLYNTAGSEADIHVDVYDWQDNVDSVSLWCSPFTGNSTLPFSKESGNTWSMTLVNSSGVQPGNYIGCVFAQSSNSGATNYLYDVVGINIEEVVVEPTGDGNLIWAKSAGSTYHDYGYAITTLSDNSTVVAGYASDLATFGAGEPNETILPADNGYGFIARYRADGTLLWAKRTVWWWTGITTLSDDSIVVTTHGRFARYNSAGILVWEKSVGGADIIAQPDDSTVITGYFFGQQIFGSPGPNEISPWWFGGHDIFIARYFSDGTLAWVKSAGSSFGDEGLAISSLSDSSTVITGYFNEDPYSLSGAIFGFREPNETTLISDGGIDLFIARYNPDGTLAWAKRAGGESVELGRSITTLSDNSTVVTGPFMNIVTFGEGEPNETILTPFDWDAIFIARYELDGSLAWAKRAGGVFFHGLQSIDGNGISTLSDDSAVVTGYFYGTATFGEGEMNETILTASFGLSSDIFIARYNRNGSLAWAKHVGGNEACGKVGNAITTLSDDSTVMTGYFSVTATFGPGESTETTLTSAGYYDIFIARFAP